MPPRFGSSSATAGAAIDIALSKTATVADFPIGCLKLDLPVPRPRSFATPAKAGAHFTHGSRPSPGWQAVSIRFTAFLGIDLFVEPDCRQVLIDEMRRGDFEALHIGPVRHDPMSP